MKQGTKVQLNTTCYGLKDKYNPQATEGIVIGENPRANEYYIFTEEKFNPVIVEWANGLRNSYKKSQLKTL
jgi:hypothetical protein